MASYLQKPAGHWPLFVVYNTGKRHQNFAHNLRQLVFINIAYLFSSPIIYRSLPDEVLFEDTFQV